MTDWFGDAVLSGSLIVAIPVAALAGLVSFFSPCVLPLLPGYLSYVSGVGVQDLRTSKRWRLALGSALFVLGFTAVFVAGGALFGAAGQRLRPYGDTLTIVAGAVLIVLGLVFVGLIPGLQRQWRMRQAPKIGLLAAPLLGVVFGIGWTPCLGPTLSAVLILAGNEGTASRGALLTLVYGLGLGLPFIVAALFFARFMGALDAVKRHQRAVSITGGVLLIVTGLLMVSGLWTELVFHLQQWAADFEVVV
ncbi:cytochrome C biogenesis protein ResC [Aeromicrobium sp. PE09-221]|uniref:cytochrome c biogenesis CcdA family protein n=1 Tax=Aeromicrobium sp. PE09-221 TaxID=1898043 RepID=UPI000B3E7EC4|nr:cytochrome c biogenesis protein CcdA [Aeromicrobium sp. PE09-221]OUZ07841.1 cytochrome C biogenesis protein ResC [Aeromicrobium sp. PE09-221]